MHTGTPHPPCVCRALLETEERKVEKLNKQHDRTLKILHKDSIIKVSEGGLLHSGNNNYNNTLKSH